MPAMTQTRPDRVRSEPEKPFVACTNLPIRQEELSRERMAEISGEFGIGAVIAIGVGTSMAATAIWHYRREIYDGTCRAADWCGDRVSEGIHEISWHTIGECYPGEHSGH